ncbi:MAG: TolC family protein [Candidatus Delongbacteria bacterium]|jgi:outer membrane protein|nr:TolC family protein [Candidatus Delongbacteria bacterium]
MKKHILIIFLTLYSPLILFADQQMFSLEDCIDYALKNSIDINRSDNDVKIQNANLGKSKAARLPNLQLGLNQQLSSVSNYDAINNEWDRNNNTTLNASLNSQVTLYNGSKLINSIRQSKTDLEAAELTVQTYKESISLNILSSYVTILLAKDNLVNSKLQLEATQEQLAYSESRKKIGVISLVELLKIKSQVATDKTTLIEAESNLRIALVSLMQLMNMPVNEEFDIHKPDIDKIIEEKTETDPDKVYKIALELQPQIKEAALNIESFMTGIDIAKADALPVLALNGGINAGYSSSMDDVDFGEQFTNSIDPYVGLSLSIPIYQRNQVKTQVEIAKIQKNNSELDLSGIKNSLRKNIELVCTDAQTALTTYKAIQEQLNAEKESYNATNEMYMRGMLNSVDILISKNDLIIAENKFTQAKYNLILQNKILEYYLGNSITL